VEQLGAWSRPESVQAGTGELARPQLGHMVGGDAVEATISHLAFDAAFVWLGCPSSTARADSPSIRWGNRPAPATCVLESRSSTRLGSGPRPCLVVTPTMLDEIPHRARILGSVDRSHACLSGSRTWGSPATGCRSGAPTDPTHRQGGPGTIVWRLVSQRNQRIDRPPFDLVTPSSNPAGTVCTTPYEGSTRPDHRGRP
jgi:hypothetical protein